MAQVGDTITYTYSDGSVVSEDVSGVDEAVVDYCDGAGGISQSTDAGSGGRVENATIDVSNQSTLYIWVGASSQTGSGDKGNRRYIGGQLLTPYNGASTEISLFNTTVDDSSDEPFLVGSGAGGSGFRSSTVGDVTADGARGVTDNTNAEGTAPPAGGEGAPDGSSTGNDGDGAIDDQNRGLVSGGTTIKGGGSAQDTDAEIQLSFKSGLQPPDPPSNLTAEVQ